MHNHRRYGAKLQDGGPIFYRKGEKFINLVNILSDTLSAGHVSTCLYSLAIAADQGWIRTKSVDSGLHRRDDHIQSGWRPATDQAE